MVIYKTVSENLPFYEDTDFTIFVETLRGKRPLREARLWHGRCSSVFDSFRCVSDTLSSGSWGNGMIWTERAVLLTSLTRLSREAIDLDLWIDSSDRGIHWVTTAQSRTPLIIGATRCAGPTHNIRSDWSSRET